MNTLTIARAFGRVEVHGAGDDVCTAPVCTTPVCTAPMTAAPVEFRRQREGFAAGYAHTPPRDRNLRIAACTENAPRATGRAASVVLG